jgi:ABC-type nitrate/sulfonate/bicarbonate transport system permease component
VSWILFAVLWFPGVEFRICFVLVVVCGPVFLIDTLDAMHGVPRDLRHMMQSFRPTTWQYFFKLMLPAILPTIFTSWKVNISLAIRVVTIAELVGAVTGIGHRCRSLRSYFPWLTYSPGRWFWWCCCSCLKRSSQGSKRAYCGGAYE